MQNPRSRSYRNYNTGHPWYYFLGGPVLTPKQILENTRYSGYKGYRDDEIARLDRKVEPECSNNLRKLRCELIAKLKEDISGYRKRALELHRYRALNNNFTDVPVSCDDIHQNISLKHNHLVNGFAHLVYVDECLNQQGDLFGVWQ